MRPFERKAHELEKDNAHAACVFRRFYNSLMRGFDVSPGLMMSESGNAVCTVRL